MFMLVLTLCVYYIIYTYIYIFIYIQMHTLYFIHIDFIYTKYAQNVQKVAVYYQKDAQF